MAFDQGDEIAGAVAGERGSGELAVGREVAFRRGLQIGEIAAPASGYQDLPARLSCMIDKQYPPAALTCDRSAHHARAAGAHYDGVVFGVCIGGHAAVSVCIDL